MDRGALGTCPVCPIWQRGAWLYPIFSLSFNHIPEEIKGWRENHQFNQLGYLIIIYMEYRVIQGILLIIFNKCTNKLNFD